MRKTKIVCTMGPATEDDKVLRELMRSGMAVARFNFSHGDHEMHKKRWNALCACGRSWISPLPPCLIQKGRRSALAPLKTGRSS